MSELKLFARRIKQARLGAGYTQREFAPMLGVSQPRLSEFERGVGGESIIRAARLLKVLQEHGVELEDLV